MQPLLDGATEKLATPWHSGAHAPDHGNEASGAHPVQGPLALGPGGGSTASLAEAFSGLVDGAGPHEAGTRSISPLSALAKPKAEDKTPSDKDTPQTKSQGRLQEEGEVEKPKPGLFPGVTDLTGTYGALAAGKRSSTQGVVLHRTESTTASSTLNGYKDRIDSGSNIGAQYLIDEKGATSLVTPQDSRVYHAKGFNDATLGVEVVGPAKSFDRSGKKGSIREQLTGMNLSPEFKQRLLGYDDKKLSNVAAG